MFLGIPDTSDAYSPSYFWLISGLFLAYFWLVSGV
jgi:hypothetical protein